MTIEPKILRTPTPAQSWFVHTLWYQMLVFKLHTTRFRAVTHKKEKTGNETIPRGPKEEAPGMPNDSFGAPKMTSSASKILVILEKWPEN